MCTVKKLFFGIAACGFILSVALCFSSTAYAKRENWKQSQVNWRLPGGGYVKAIKYPDKKKPRLLQKHKGLKAKALRKEILSAESISQNDRQFIQDGTPVIVNVIDSPPIDGFVPWIAVSVTDKRMSDLDSVFDAQLSSSVVGNYLCNDPAADYAVGIFDTGASAHVMGNIPATQTGLTGDYLTSNSIEVSGVTGSTYAWVTQPIGLFIDGIGAVEPNGLLNNNENMVGQWNVTISVGQGGDPDLPTAIGSPMSVFYATEIRHDQQAYITHNQIDYNAPDIRFYEPNDPCGPSYSNRIPLELRPLGASTVQYTYTLDTDTFEFVPTSPSIIIGNLSQSLFFISSVDIYDNNNVAYDEDRFMVDTGAQISVIGSRIAARLALDTDNPDFQVEIEGVSGDISYRPGFYIDSLQIPALGQWLKCTNVPVVWLDVSSPEGGTFDGIIGMNLFTDLNLIIRGGGMFLQDDPVLEFEPIPQHLTADIAPRGGDGIVDFLDLSTLAYAWLGTNQPRTNNWNTLCDLAPTVADGKVDMLDLAVFLSQWQQSL